MGEIILNGKSYNSGMKYKEVTQAEYNALPSSKLTDGTLYCITDAPGPGEGFPHLIYSTEEREIGVWKDGKPLYQKTVSFTTEASGGYRTYSTGLTNIELALIDYDHSYYINSVSKIQATPYASAVDTMQFSIFASIVNTDELRLDYRVGASAESKSAVITLQYTKTTDQPGGGTWSPSGSLQYKTTKIASYDLTPSLVQSTSNLIKSFSVPYVGYYSIGMREVYNRNNNRSWMNATISSGKGLFLDVDDNSYTDVRAEASGYSQFIRTIPIYISDITAVISFYLWGNGYNPNSVKITVNKIN